RSRLDRREPREGPMRCVARIVAIGSAVGLLSPPTLPQKNTDDYHPRPGFSGNRTFSIKEGAPIAGTADKTTPYERPIVRQNTDQAVAWQLEARGLKRDDVHPDVYVTTRRSFQTEYEAWGWPGWGYGYWGYYSYGSYYLEPIVVGTLTVDVTNARTGE